MSFPPPAPACAALWRGGVKDELRRFDDSLVPGGEREPRYQRCEAGEGAIGHLPGLVPGIHVLVSEQASRGWPGKRAFTPVFDGLCPAMTKVVSPARNPAA